MYLPRHAARSLFVLSCLQLSLIFVSPSGAHETSPQPTADRFQTVVAPALSQKCVACHRPDNLKGGFDLSTREGLLKGGAGGPALVPGSPLESPVYTRAIPQAGQPPEMPEQGTPLTDEEAEGLRVWIAEGANWPAGLTLREQSKGDASFWSFQPVAQSGPPVLTNVPPGWDQNPIDLFVLAKMREQGLTPNPPTEAQNFLRRATYDLTGLPPTPEELAEFQTSAANGLTDVVVQQLIDRLLDRPQYGEHWGRHWLDVIRFGESRGYERNEIITNLWPFRDYVIRSLNDDKPFDRLIHEHLAGDVLGPDQPEVEVGSAFLVAGPYDDVGNQDAVAAAQIRADQLDEMVRASAEAFLGLSIGCARCHDHKFDPISTQDYYALTATFAGTLHGQREVASAAQRAERVATLQKLQTARAELVQRRDSAKQQSEQPHAGAPSDTTAPTAADLELLNTQLAQLDSQIAQVPAHPVWWVGTHQAAPGPFHVFVGGNTQRLGSEVVPASLSVLGTLPSAYRLDSAATESARRLAFAKWLTAPDHPLTSRVLANRVWQYHFGRGIVETPSDFGYLGGRPSHPELLDWLAREVQHHGWKLKPLHRLMMTSQAYRQSAGWNESNARIDADSRLLWRFPPRRLSAEEVRDTLLQVTGQLDLTMYSRGFQLYEYQQDNVATYVPLDSHGRETYRRAVYHHNARSSRVDVLTDFDCPDPSMAEPRRASTTTPLQALTMLNHRFAFDMAQFLAARLEQEAVDSSSRVHRAFLLCFTREPNESELSAGISLIERHGLLVFCRALLNANELVMCS